MSKHDNINTMHEMAKVLGLSPSDLVEVGARLTSTHHTPTIAEFHPSVVAACSAKSLPTYQTHFKRLVNAYPDVGLDDVNANQLDALRDQIILDVATAKVAAAEAAGRPLRSYEIDAHGRGAGENFVRAARFFFKVAKKEKLIHSNPAMEVDVPKRLPAPERPLLPWELEEFATVCCTTGNDPDLDSLLFEFHRKTAARREGGLNLRVSNLDSKRGAVTLTEKFGKPRDLPLDAEFINRLRRFAASRGASKPSDHVFRGTAGRPITRRRYETIYDRIDAHTTWGRVLDVGMHWIRHTTLDDVRTVAGMRVASAYAGHSAEASDATINIYTRVTFEELCSAFEAIFGARFSM